MRTSLNHLQFTINPANFGFYRDLFGFLGWPTIHEGDDILGLAGQAGDSIWFTPRLVDGIADHDAAGLNHIGIGAESIADVDATVARIQSMGLAPLFETPRHRPEFASDENSTYYQVMFESPDRILFEVVYTGPK